MEWLEEEKIAMMEIVKAGMDALQLVRKKRATCASLMGSPVSQFAEMA